MKKTVYQYKVFDDMKELNEWLKNNNLPGFNLKTINTQTYDGVQHRITYSYEIDS